MTLKGKKQKKKTFKMYNSESELKRCNIQEN